MYGSVSVSRNVAEFGGGIYNQTGPLIMNDSSRVNLNTASVAGGGSDNGVDGGVTILNDSSRVNRNTAGSSGGGIYSDTGASLVGAVGGVNVASNKPDDIVVVV